LSSATRNALDLDDEEADFDGDLLKLQEEHPRGELQEEAESAA